MRREVKVHEFPKASRRLLCSLFWKPYVCGGGGGDGGDISPSVELSALCGIAPLLKVHNILSFLTAPKIVNLIDSNRGVALAHN